MHIQTLMHLHIYACTYVCRVNFHVRMYIHMYVHTHSLSSYTGNNYTHIPPHRTLINQIHCTTYYISNVNIARC